MEGSGSALKPLAILCGYTVRFVSDLVGDQKTGFLTTQFMCKSANDNLYVCLLKYSEQSCVYYNFMFFCIL